MGALLPENKFWSPADWVSRAFFEDCIEIANEKKQYKDILHDIKTALEDYSFTLDYRNESSEKLNHFKALVEDIIRLNEKKRG